MLNFSRRQMSNIGDIGMNQSIATMLKRAVPGGQTLSDLEMNSTISMLVSHCRNNGLRNQRAIASYVLGSYMIGSDNVLRNPTLSNILGSRFLPQSHKTIAIQMWLTHITTAMARVRR